MSVKKQWTIEQAENFLDQISDSIGAASPGEIEEDVLSSGEDVEALAAQTRAALLAGVKKFQQQKLHHARQRYKESSQRIESRERRIAPSVEARRFQFFDLLKANPGIQSALTMQHRDLGSLTDGDIESALEELDALGAIEDLGEKNNESES
jgi:FMN phosphatase YigB (HAD superfamily)